jgi:exo-beta-1,3-glucanase (GH17 family)
MLKFFKPLFLLPLIFLVSFHSQTVAAKSKASHEALQCVAFSPYVDKLNPDYGPKPSKELIGKLLDRLVADTPFRCILTFGVINGLEAVFPEAEARNIKVIAVLWIDKDKLVNSQSISSGIQLARQYEKTIIKLSCGSEVRTRHGFVFDSEISRCIQAMREAKIKQPVTTIDTWWEWCNRELKCEQTVFSKQVDWVGINVYPWWEDRYSGIHPCTTAEKAADFHVARVQELQKVNPDKEVAITEFGWPSGPPGAIAVNDKTGERCGVAGAEQQALVIKSTFKKLAEMAISAVVFEAFSENWKPGDEGEVGRFWGVCQGDAPYACNKALKRFE